mgnify:CR=1 FL=1
MRELGSGDFFGEMSLFDGQPRSATIQADTDTVLYAGGYTLVIVATNTWGDDSVYGSISGLSRVSTQLDWITSVFPGIRTAR